jgi:XTP/dITP diphosphohydrolase
MPVRLVIATRNRGKRREFEALCQGLPVEIASLEDFPGVVDPEETGTTFRENAIIKADAAARATGCWALGDDSGLCVDVLGGAPGIYSARYAEGTDMTRWQKLLSELRDVPDDKRGAAFVCTLALAGPRGDLVITEGRCDGRIARAPRGESGFGYDPVFLVAGDPAERTMAELPEEAKNRVSHRGRAFAVMRGHLVGIRQS